jgi:hypothetical protein
LLAHLYKNIPFLPASLLLLVLFVLQGCANIVPPEGGKKDETPPVLLSSRPVDSSLNIKMSKITLHFNKFMEIRDLQNNLLMSPLLPINPTVVSYGKRVEIKMEDSFLQPNTTYRLALGDALVDNREATPYKNFVYIFSTGSYFDSLNLHGRVFDAATGLPDSTTTIFLYPESENDSAVVRKKPAYAQKTDADGHFSFGLLPNKGFRAFAVQDADNNYIYSPATEKIDFLDYAARPLFENDSLLTFFIFKEVIDSTLEAETGALTDRSGTRGRQRARSYPKNDPGYLVKVDTLNREKGSFDLTGPLIVELHKPLAEIDSSRIFLSYDDNGIDVEAVRKLGADSSDITIYSTWQADRIYTLRLVKGWARDTSGAELPPGKYFFRTKRTEDYGTLRLHIDSALTGKNFVLYIQKETDSIYQQAILSADITLPLLQPGNYILRIILDENENGKWDTGNLFEKKHAEKVISYPGNVVLKSGWENEIDFKKPDETKTKADRFSESPGTQQSPNKQ